MLSSDKVTYLPGTTMMEANMDKTVEQMTDDEYAAFVADTAYDAEEAEEREALPMLHSLRVVCTRIGCLVCDPIG